MARVPDHPTSASLGQKTMLRSIQCPSCGVVLNVPESAAGRRLKCPHCTEKFQAPAAVADDSVFAAPPAKTPHTPAPGSSSSGGDFDLPNSPQGSSGSIELPTSSGDTLDLPLFMDDPPKPAVKPRSPGASTVSGAASASGLFSDDLPKPAVKPRSPGASAIPGAGASGLFSGDPANPSQVKPRSPGASTVPAVGDARALFQDEPKAARKPKGAEARATARRCPSCGGVVGVGMSLCKTCGLDLDTGQRVAPLDVFDEDMPAAVRPPMPSLGILFVGSLCALVNLLLSVVSLAAWNRGENGEQYLLVIWLFGIYASVQFLRRKSTRLLILSMSLKAGIGAIYLLVLPIVAANTTTSALPVIEQVNANNGETEEPAIRPITDNLDMTKIYQGVASLLIYAGLIAYLNSPALRRDFKR